MLGCSTPTVNLGPPHISETIRARKLKFYTHLDGPSTLFGYDNFSARRCAAGAALRSVNLGPLISHKVVELES